MQKLLITHCVRAHVALTAFPTSHSLQWVVSLSGMLLNLCEGLRKAIPSICTIMKHHIVPTLLLMWGWAICSSQNKKIYTRRPTFSVAFLLWKYALLLALPKQLYSGLQEKFSTLYLIKNKTHKQQKKTHKSSKHPMHKPWKRRFHFLVVRAALSVLQQMSLLAAFACLAEVAKEEIKFVICKMQNFCFSQNCHPVVHYPPAITPFIHPVKGILPSCQG